MTLRRKMRPDAGCKVTAAQRTGGCQLIHLPMGLGVDFVTTSTMLRTERARFVLPDAA